MPSTAPLLTIEGLTIGIARPDTGGPTILDGIDLNVGRGETLGIVGESGSGKSTLLLSLLGFIKPGLRVVQGAVKFHGVDLIAAPPETLRALRAQRIGFVPQIAATALNPVMRIGRHLNEALMLAGIADRSERRIRQEDLLESVDLHRIPRILKRYPHELSGGQQQRIAIALAMAGNPDLIVLDEPTSALDPATRDRILQLLRRLIAERGTTMVYVSHDLGVIRHVTDRVAVLYAGEIIEDSPTAAAISKPLHPYLKGLIGAMPAEDGTSLPRPLPGIPPAPGARPFGCRFAPRCGLAVADTCTHPVGLSAVSSDRRVRCLYPHAPDDAAADRQVRIRVPRDLGAPLLQLEALRFGYRSGFFQNSRGAPVIDGVSLSLARGETLGLVGGSGSGKSTILKAVAGLLQPDEGSIRFDGQDIAQPVTRRPASVRQRIQIIFQNPESSLNPRQTIREIIARPLNLYFSLTSAERDDRIRTLAAQTRLSRRHLDLLPHNLSGGERQRVAIARAFAAEPELILADEITSALDVSVQAAIVDLVLEMTEERGAAMLFVSHDLPLVQALSNRYIRLDKGVIVTESAGRAEGETR